MFEDSLVESSGKLAQRNPWTTAFSFVAQILLAGILVLLPLIYTEALPEQHLLRIFEAPSPPPAVVPATPRIARSAESVSELDHGVLRPPAEIPRAIRIVRDEEDGAGVPGGVLGVPNGIPNNVIAELIRDTPPALPKVPAQKTRVSSGVAQGLLVDEVQPQYPALARQARIQGTVVLQAMIGKDGTVQKLHIVSGHPMLTQAAIEAVKQWRYKPYYLNGEAVEVDTQISINFTLTGG